jgi:hypothetical protein
VFLATQEAEIGRIEVQSQLRHIVHDTLSRKKPFTKIGLVEWLKVKALSSNSSTIKENKKHTQSKQTAATTKKLNCRQIHISQWKWGTGIEIKTILTFFGGTGV